ncbi:MAG TPA: DUF6468 domain-containing protein [Xanthobacteraceae bacterium]|jgi:hypothetical protein|nr:DUF6468 domain-containing protein [Xanthobacteraceae bacterium]
MTNSLAIMIDGMVAILLVLTICYCITLNRKLKLLKADEQSLRATISELVTATEIAERAIGGLKLTVHECDMSLGERLRKAERVSIEIDRAVVAGKDLVNRVSQMVAAGRSGARAKEADVVPIEVKAADASSTRPVEVAAPAAMAGPGTASAKAVAAAAEAFTERLRNKVHGLAA